MSPSPSRPVRTPPPRLLLILSLVLEPVQHRELAAGHAADELAPTRAPRSSRVSAGHDGLDGPARPASSAPQLAAEELAQQRRRAMKLRGDVGAADDDRLDSVAADPRADDARATVRDDRARRC